MQPAYIIQDEEGNSGQTLQLTQGDQKTFKIFLFKPDGTPLFIPGTLATVVLKCFSTINGPSLQYTLAGEAVTPIADENLGCFGFQWTMPAADTVGMAANNAGGPLRITVTATGPTATQELDFLAVFQVLAPSVTN